MTFLIHGRRRRARRFEERQIAGALLTDGLLNLFDRATIRQQHPGYRPPLSPCTRRVPSEATVTSWIGPSSCEDERT